MAKLTAKTITQISEAGRYGDGNGLYLVVSPAGTKSWIQRVQIGGKRTDKGLGGLGKVSLASARKIAAANTASIKAGNNPFEAGYVAPPVKEVPAIPTFADAARAVYALNLEEWGEGTAKRWLRRLEIHAFPTLAKRNVAEITRSDLAELLTPLRGENHETARKVRQALAKVFRWARAHDYRVDDPADDALGELVKKVKHLPEHHKALPFCEVGRAIRKVQFGYAMRVTALAFEFLILTAARTSEVRGMEWAEVDLENAVWEIPAERMKGRRSHRVPLSDQAMAILRQVRYIPDPDADDDSIFQLVEVTEGRVFRMPTGKPLSENALLDRCEKDKIGATPHGFRTSFRGWAKAEYKGRWEAIELSLAHAVGTSVTQAYDRDDLLEERAAMMQAWADYLDPAPF
jgi:integrase